ncbi:catalase/peroxidase [Ectocarpus siliculosus]|uniref:Catalase/peroxidase n=1 Tax=Ectocarpus siliculosus TaxID=2880 RepID=D7G525_ECTSI|nr:catalase/peroxidase [Ectocarpus siliculosus]|eukprot:CBJ33788.1 catalase/peroxidase [Ectocarpus siliculosus]
MPVAGIVGTGSLHALEVDTEGAVQEYKEMELKGGRLMPVAGIVGTGSLHALEVDTEGAAQEYKEVAKGAAGVSLTLVPYFDVEVRNVYGLRFMAQTLFAPRDKA